MDRKKYSAGINAFYVVLLFFFFVGQLKATIFNSRPSASQKLIHLSIDGVRYVIPRNYIFAMDDWNGGPQKSITLRVTYPEFLPYMPSTKECMERKKRCVVIEMHISKVSRLSDINILDNNFYEGNKLKNKEYDYEVSTIGVPTALTKYYRNKNKNIYFHCIHVGNRGAASCRIIHKLKTGSEFVFHFQPSLIPEIATIVNKTNQQLEIFSKEASL